MYTGKEEGIKEGERQKYKKKMSEQKRGKERRKVEGGNGQREVGEEKRKEGRCWRGKGKERVGGQ